MRFSSVSKGTFFCIPISLYVSSIFLKKSFKSSLNIWPDTIKLCEEKDCYKVLGIATSSKPPSTIDSYKHGDLFHKFNIDHKFKIAWVELNPDSYEGIKFIETAGRNPEPYMEQIKSGNIKVIHKCTSVRHALKAQSIGCDAVSVDGFECGGHPG